MEVCKTQMETCKTLTVTWKQVRDLPMVKRLSMVACGMEAPPAVD